MKLLYLRELMYQLKDKIGEDITSVQIFSQSEDTEQFNSNLIIIVLYVEY